MGLRPLALAAVLLASIVFVPPAHAQFLVAFNFDTLWFKFHPAGIASTQASGSGLEVFAQNVKIEGAEVQDLRACIDGWGEPECSYGSILSTFYQANKDGTVDQAEVDRFEKIAVLGAQRIEKIERMSEMLKRNVTIDGVTGGDPRVVELDFREAIGPIAATTPAFADVKSEVGYANDKNAQRHEIHVRGFHLDLEGFQYTTVKWTLEGDKKWVFKPSDTLPETRKDKVSGTGWTSNQAEFESSTDSTLRIVVEVPAKKKSPGFELVVVAGAVGLALLGAARRRSR